MDAPDSEHQAVDEQFDYRSYERWASQAPLDDPSVGDLAFNRQNWYQIVHRVRQQDAMMKAIINIFAWPAGSDAKPSRRGHRKAGRAEPSAAETPNRPQAAV